MTELYTERTDNIAPAQQSDINTGTTTNSYAEARRVDGKSLKEKTLVLTNTHGSNGLTYKVEVYAAKHGAGQAYALVSDVELAASEQALITLKRRYAAVVVSVKSTVTDTHATYQIDYTGSTI